VLGPIVSLEAGADETVVVRKSVGIGLLAEPAKQRRRSLNIGEKEGEDRDAESLRDGALAGLAADRDFPLELIILECEA
jgi:hypothetical protein